MVNLITLGANCFLKSNIISYIFIISFLDLQLRKSHYK